MENYDLIIIGTGSAMNYINPIIDLNPEMRIAVIDKDEPAGSVLPEGVSLQKSCSTLPNSSGRLETASLFGIKLEIKDVDFLAIMERMRRKIGENIEAIRKGWPKTRILTIILKVRSLSLLIP